MYQIVTLLLLFAVSSADPSETGNDPKVAKTFTDLSNVINFDQESFKASKIGFIRPNKAYLVVFYTPWCHHCKRLVSQFEKMEKLENVTLGAVDCTQEADLCERFIIEGYPTILFFSQSNVMYRYGGPRTAHDLQQFVQKEYEYMQAEKIPQTTDKFAKFKKRLNQPSVIVAFSLMAIFTLILILVCVMDYRENKELDEVKKELEGKKGGSVLRKAEEKQKKE